MPSLGTAAILDEVRQTHRVIEPFPNRWYQTLGHHMGLGAQELLKHQSRSELRQYVGPTFWDIGGGTKSANYPYDADWACQNRGTSPKICADRYYRESQVRGGGIVLFHDIHDVTIEMLKLLVPRWKQNAYSFVGIDEVPSIQEALVK